MDPYLEGYLWPDVHPLNAWIEELLKDVRKAD